MQRKIGYVALGVVIFAIHVSASAQGTQICGVDAEDAPAHALELLISQVAERCKAQDTSCDVTDFSDEVGQRSVSEMPAVLGRKVYKISAASSSDEGGKMWVRGTVECSPRTKKFTVTSMQAGHGGNTFDLDSDSKSEKVEKSDDCPSTTPYLFESVAYVSGNVGPACCSEPSLSSHCVIPPPKDCSGMGAGKWDLVNGQCLPHVEGMKIIKPANPCQILNPSRDEIQQCLDQNKDQDSDDSGTAGSGA